MLGDLRAAEIANIFLEYSPLVKSKENGGRQNSKTHTHWEKRTMTQVRFVRVSVARNLQAPGRRDFVLPQIAKLQAPNATIRYFFEKRDSFAATHGFKLPMPSKPTKSNVSAPALTPNHSHTTATAPSPQPPASSPNPQPPCTSPNLIRKSCLSPNFWPQQQSQVRKIPGRSKSRK